MDDTEELIADLNRRIAAEDEAAAIDCARYRAECDDQIRSRRERLYYETLSLVKMRDGLAAAWARTMSFDTPTMIMMSNPTGAKNA